MISDMLCLGVDPWTLKVGCYMMQIFNPSFEGLRHIETAIESLKWTSSWDKAIWFGFGHETITRELMTWQQGGMFIGLASALAECYGINYTARVLHEMVLKLQAPPKDRPSVG